MCGILASIQKPARGSKLRFDTNEFIINAFEEQNNRGKEGFGIIRFKNGKLQGVDRACTPHKFLIDLYQKPAESIIAHHRNPTSTDNKLGQTHPIYVSNPELMYDYLIVHNGVISNADTLRKKHVELGYEYNTFYQEISGYHTTYTKDKFNDSEAFAIDLARYIELKIKELESDGSMAFIAMQLEKDSEHVNQIYFGRRLNPLTIKHENGVLLLASENLPEDTELRTLYSFDPKILGEDGKFILKQEDLVFFTEKEAERKKAQEEEEKKTKGQLEVVKANQSVFNWAESKKQDTSTTSSSKDSKTEDYSDPLGLGAIDELDEDIRNVKADVMTQLQATDQLYWSEMTQEKIEDRDSASIEQDLDYELERRIDLCAEMLNGYAKSLMGFGFQVEKGKSRKQAVLEVISKILTSMEAVTQFEHTNLGHALAREMEDEDESKLYRIGGQGNLEEIREEEMDAVSQAAADEERKVEESLAEDLGGPSDEFEEDHGPRGRMGFLSG